MSIGNAEKIPTPIHNHRLRTSAINPKHISTKRLYRLDFEAVGSSATTSLLELSAFRNNSGLDAIVCVRVVGGCAVTKISDSFTGILSTTEKNSVTSFRAAKSQLIQGDALATSLNNSSSGSLGESQGSNCKLRNLQQTRVISHGTNNHSGFAILSLQVSGQSGQRDGRVVNFGHSQSLDNGRGKFRLSTSGQKAVKNIRI